MILCLALSPVVPCLWVAGKFVVCTTHEHVAVESSCLTCLHWCPVAVYSCNGYCLLLGQMAFLHFTKGLDKLWFQLFQSSECLVLALHLSKPMRPKKVLSPVLWENHVPIGHKSHFFITIPSAHPMDALKFFQVFHFTTFTNFQLLLWNCDPLCKRQPLNNQ